MSLGEVGTIWYRTNERRVKDWGFHCEWPPQWIAIPESVRNFTRGNTLELEEIYQRAFEKKVKEALGKLYRIATENLSFAELMQLSREHGFWIWTTGEVTFPRPLWV